METRKLKSYPKVELYLSQQEQDLLNDLREQYKKKLNYEDVPLDVFVTVLVSTAIISGVKLWN